MNVVFVAKKVTLTDDFKQKAEKKLIKIEKVLQDPTVNVAVTAIKDMAIVELTIKNNNLSIFPVAAASIKGLFCHIGGNTNGNFNDNFAIILIIDYFC